MPLSGTTEITFHNGDDAQQPSTAVYFDLIDASECLTRLKALELEILKIEVIP